MAGSEPNFADISVDPSSIDEKSLAPADRFCWLSSLHYNETDAPPRYAAAAGLLTANPGLVDHHIWAAASAADPDALARHLSVLPDSAQPDPAPPEPAPPEPAKATGGPFGWAPLLYLCFARAPLNRSGADVLTAATMLLDAGADPNEGYLWCGMPTPFTVLTGVFGEGEQGPRRQPRHPFAPALAELLLSRGAHPVDQQALYNRMFRPDDSHLELLFAYGLADAGPSPWEDRLGAAMETREQMWQRQVSWAAEHGFVDRLNLLALQGVNVAGVDVAGVEVVVPSMPADPNSRDADGATALHHAAWDGDTELIQRLLDAGADPTITDLRFGTMPVGWAEHAYQSEAADLLRVHTPG